MPYGKAARGLGFDCRSYTLTIWKGSPVDRASTDITWSSRPFTIVNEEPSRGFERKERDGIRYRNPHIEGALCPGRWRTTDKDREDLINPVKKGAHLDGLALYQPCGNKGVHQDGLGPTNPWEGSPALTLALIEWDPENYSTLVKKGALWLGPRHINALA